MRSATSSRKTRTRSQSRRPLNHPSPTRSPQSRGRISKIVASLPTRRRTQGAHPGRTRPVRHQVVLPQPARSRSRLLLDPLPRLRPGPNLYLRPKRETPGMPRSPPMTCSLGLPPQSFILNSVRTPSKKNRALRACFFFNNHGFALDPPKGLNPLDSHTFSKLK